MITTAIHDYYVNGLRVAQQRDGEFTWIHADHLHSATRLTDGNGLEVRRLAYTAFGEEAENQGSGTSPKHTYTGKEKDTTGLLYDGARYDDPALCRFLTADTLYDHGPQGLNRYAYAQNNPILYRDPTGHLSYYDDSDPEVWRAPEDDFGPWGTPLTIEKADERDSIDLGDGIRVRKDDLSKGRPVVEEYQDASPDERAFHEWRASDPISRIGVPIPACSVNCPLDPNQMQYHTGLGMGLETFRRQLGYLNESGENLDGYTVEELDALYVKARREEQAMAVGLSLGIQAGMTLGNIRATAEVSKLHGRQLKHEFSGSKITRLKKNMQQHGFDPNYPIDVIEVNGRKIIIDGHHRARAAGSAGIKEVPVRIHQVDAATAAKLEAQAVQAAENLGLSHRW